MVVEVCGVNECFHFLSAIREARSSAKKDEREGLRDLKRQEKI